MDCRFTSVDKQSLRPRPHFRFLRSEEFQALPPEKKVAYLKIAIRAVAEKMDEVAARDLAPPQHLN